MKIQSQTRARCCSPGVVAALCLVLIAFFGCSDRSKQQPPPNDANRTRVEPQPLEHRVSYSGETLALIASWYTGRSQNWTLIRDANPNLRPERINLGQRILIPANLVVERNPMPKKFVQDSLAKVTRPKPSVDDTSTPPSDAGSAPDTAPPTDSAVTEPKHSQPSEEDINLNELIGKDDVGGGTDSGAAKQPATPEPTKAVVKEPEPAAKEPEKKPPAATGDAEREQLLDELLAQ